MVRRSATASASTVSRTDGWYLVAFGATRRAVQTEYLVSGRAEPGGERAQVEQCALGRGSS